MSNAEHTERARAEALQLPLTLYYDGLCPLCTAEVKYLMLRDTDQRLRFVDVQQAGFVSPIDGVSMQQMLALIHAQTADGQVLVGVDAFERAYRAVGIDWVAAALRLPGVSHLARSLYPWIVRHRMQIPRWVTQQVFGRATERAERRWAKRQALRAVAQQCSEELCARP